MNWARVKTILIVVFLLINIFLIIKVNDKYGHKDISRDEIESLKNLISQKGILLNTTIPSKIYNLPRMKIANKIIDEKVTADNVLGKGKWKTKSDSKNNTIYYTDELELEFDKYGFIIIKEKTNAEEVLKINNKEAVSNMILNRAKRFMPIDKYVVDFSLQGKKSNMVGFSYFEKDNEVFNNYLFTKVRKDGEIVYKMGMTEFSGFSSKSKKVTSVEALVEFIRTIKDEKDVSVEKISIGYYLNLNGGNEVFKSGDAEPAWKITTNNGVYIYDGYTGKLLLKFIEGNQEK